jgi:hypothetical protein
MEFLKKYENNMAIGEVGVKERFGSEEKLYNTTTNSCNCSYWHNWRGPCRYVIFLRKHENLPIFDKSLFPEYYLQQRVHDINSNVEDMLDASEDANESLNVSLH